MERNNFYEVIFVVFVFASLCDYCAAVPTRLTMSRCNYNGFTCTSNGRNLQEVTYQCPSPTTDVKIDVNDFSLPTNIETLVLKNCQKLTISTKCSNVIRKDFRYVHIINIKTLVIQIEHETFFPPVLKMANISYIETIPSNAFVQTDRSIPSRCNFPQKEFSELYMSNVFVDTMMTNAFHMPKEFQRVHISNVTVNRLQTSAFNVGLMKNGSFVFENSKVNVVEHLGFKLQGHEITFDKNEFLDMGASAINGTITNFTFIRTYVNTLQSDAISVLSKNVNISFNRIEFAQSGAFQKIGPGLLEDSKLNFGKLRFKYQFSNNSVLHLHSGCLQPDVNAYENVASELTVTGNKIMCTCSDVGWLFSKLGYGYSTDVHTGYYEILLENRNENVCINTVCDLPVANVNRSIVHGTCKENYDFNEPCRPTTTVRPVTAMIRQQKTNQAATIRPGYGGIGSFLKSSSKTLLIMDLFISMQTLILLLWF